ncbi:MAG: alpha/beta hydrolase [Deltaproteobacteria bacterium]|nr:alpha/beta hydrolase [Deltaproteobacteria bacterium]
MIAPTQRLTGAGVSLNARCIEGDRARTVVVLHGYLDCAASFDTLCEGLARSGRHVVAMDHRGHGESDWTPPGSYYHFFNYLADLDAAITSLEISQPISLVGHSMGGNIATLFAGSRPERVAALVLAEGIGLPMQSADLAVVRATRWLTQLAQPKTRTARPMRDLAEAVARLQVAHSAVSPEVLAHHAVALLQKRDDGLLQWRFDPLLQSVSPGRFDAEAFEAFADAITAPTLLVDGGTTGLHFEATAERAARYRAVAKHTLPDAGHMMHWTAPEALTRVVDEFLVAHSR